MKTLQEFIIESMDLSDIFPQIVNGKNGKLPDSIEVLQREAKNEGPLMDYIKSEKVLPDGTVNGIEKLHDKYPEILDNIIVYTSTGPKLTLVYNKPLKKGHDQFAMLTMATNYAIINGRLEYQLEDEGMANAIKKYCK